MDTRNSRVGCLLRVSLLDGRAHPTALYVGFSSLLCHAHEHARPTDAFSVNEGVGANRDRDGDATFDYTRSRNAMLLQRLG
jgi:hypothetical protein